MNDTSPFETSDPAAAGQDVQRLVTEVFRCAHGELLGTLYYLVGNLEDARDALQEAFIKCWRHGDRAEIRDMKAWVFRVAMNTGRDMLRAAWSRRRQPWAEETAAMLTSTAPPPDAALLHQEQLEVLRKAILTLRPEEREVFLLRQNGALTYEQIAETTTAPVGTVKARMRAAVHKLHGLLAGN